MEQYKTSQDVPKASNQNKMAEDLNRDNLIVIITTSGGDEYEMRLEGSTRPRDDFAPPRRGWPPLITIFHLLNKIMLITYIALCKKEIYKD